jgi:bile acid-coenzyme A ligase
MTAPTPFGVALARLAVADPDRPAVTCAGVTRTRAQLMDRAERLAALFADLGVVEGSLVTIGLPNSIAFVEASVATWILGATPQPLSHRLPSAERAAIVELANPAVVVGIPAADTGGRPTLESLPDDLPDDRRPAADSPAAPVWKITTSGGSTGRPKLIGADQPSVLETVAGFGQLSRLPAEATVLVTGPMAHNAPFVVATVGLLTGGHIVLMERFEALECLRLVASHRVQWLYLVPTMMLRIWRLDPEVRQAADMGSIEVAFHMAAPCPPWLKEAWIDWIGPEHVFELYGGTELQAMTVITGQEWLAHRGSVGRPVLGEIEIRDEERRPVAPDVPGEIWMRRGPGAPPPYRYIGATARRDDDGWESLGDMGYQDDDGYLYITDRDTDMILVGGANVYPAEVEGALDEHPAVLSSCVIGLPDEDLGNVPHAIIELGQPATQDDLLAHLRQRLAGYKLPRSFEFVETPLRDDAGKVRRSALRSERLARRPTA